MSAIESVRRRFDPLARELRAHITLVFPFESGISTEDLRRHVEAVTASVPPFRIGFGAIISTDDMYMFLTFADGAREVASLHDGLYTGPLKQFLSVDHRFTPHITVGRAADAAGLREGLAIARAVGFGSGTRVSTVSAYRIGGAQSRSLEFEVALS